MRATAQGHACWATQAYALSSSKLAHANDVNAEVFAQHLRGDGASRLEPELRLSEPPWLRSPGESRLRPAATPNTSGTCLGVRQLRRV